MNTVEIIKTDGHKWTFHFVQVVEYKVKSGVLFIWQDSRVRPMTIIDDSKFISFKVIQQD